MQILVDEMPSHPMDCPYAEMEGNMEYQWWYCNYGECGCKNTKDCLFFMSLKTIKIEHMNVLVIHQLWTRGIKACEIKSKKRVY